jgi:hypothetical protein
VPAHDPTRPDRRVEPRPPDDLAQLGRPLEPWWQRLAFLADDGRAQLDRWRRPGALLATVVLASALVGGGVWLVAGGSSSPPGGAASALPLVSRTSAGPGSTACRPTCASPR